MRSAEFDAILSRRLKAIDETLNAKAREYAYGDRLSNFKRAAEIQRITPAQAAWNFLMKHIVSIQDMIESGDPYPREQWDEKLGDAINYLILIEAIVNESR